MMSRRALTLLAFTLAITACGAPPPAVTESLEQRLTNPLFAEYYYDDLVERLVDLDIQNDPALEDASVKAAVDTTRREGLQAAKAATKKQAEGWLGMMVPAKQFAQGEVLLVDGMLHFHPQFLSTPGIDIVVYASQAPDPREATEFPDAGALEIGQLQSPYGAQTYAMSMPETTDGQPPFRSIVLWDAVLKRIVGFAQLRSA